MTRQSRLRNAVPWILGTALAILLLVAAGLAAIAAFAINRHRAFRPPANAFLEAWEAGDRDEMWRLAGSRWQAGQPREIFDDWADRVEEALGPLEDASLRNLSTGFESGIGEYTRLTFFSEFENGNATVVITVVVQPDGSYAIEGANVDSPLLPY